jgi:sugar phosphate isomerase/epimerase
VRAISLAHLSLIASPPEELVAIAAEAGFSSVDLRLAPATQTDRVYGDSERLQLCRALLPRLADTGLKVWDVEIIRIGDRTRPEDYVPLMEAAALLGARRLKAVCDSEDQSLAADVLARLAELAAPFGLILDLEYMVFSGVKSLGAALAVTQVANQPNLQVLVDALHWVRAGDTAADLRAAPAGRIGYAQLCDGPKLNPVGREALIAEARTRRLPLGEGEFPLRALLAAMPPNCPVSIEVPLQPSMDPLQHARRLLAATQSLTEQEDAVQ